MGVANFDGQAQAGAFQDGFQAGELWIAFAGEHAVEALAVEFGVAGEFGHALGFGDVAEGEEKYVLGAVFEGGVEVCGGLGGIGEILQKVVAVVGSGLFHRGFRPVSVRYSRSSRSFMGPNVAYMLQVRKGKPVSSKR